MLSPPDHTTTTMATTTMATAMSMTMSMLMSATTIVTMTTLHYRSLFTLGNVISALSDNKKREGFIPYRDSVRPQLGLEGGISVHHTSPQQNIESIMCHVRHSRE